MSDLSAGFLTQVGGRTFISGQASRLDTAALVEVAYQQKMIPAVKIDTQIKGNEKKMEAYSQMSSLANGLQSSLERLKSIVGFGGGTNIFSQRTATFFAVDGSNPTNYLDVALSENAELGDYTIQVTQRATAQRVGSTTGIADSTIAQGFNGSFDVGLAGGTAATINITNTMTLQEIANAINAQRNTTGVQASVLKVAEGDFKLVMTATQTNKEIEISNVAGDNVMQSLGVTDGGGAFIDEIQQAKAAILTIDGITITRDSNQIEDAITGLSFNIKAENPGVNINITVERDAQGARAAVEDFIDAYNELRAFVIQNQQVGRDGSVPDSAVLFADNLLQNLNSQLGLITSSSFTSELGTQTLRDIGITLDSSNKLTISDGLKLDNAILNNYQDFRSLFESSMTTTGGELGLIRNNSSAATLNFTLDITKAGGVITDVSVGGDNSLFTVNGSSIVGNEGTIYAGLTFAYVGADSASINVNLSQGLADRMFNAARQFTLIPNGLIQQEVLRLEDTNRQLDTRALDIRQRADEYRLKQIDRYAKLEAQMQASKLIISQIKAILGVKEKDN